ncbi:hypothetical protein GCM10027299_47360 [Larkinella ripae]
MATVPFSTAFVRVPLAGADTIDQLDESRIADLIRDPRFLEALYIASPALYDEVQKLDLSLQPGFRSDEKNRRVLYSLIKYAARYATRCTPFGLFSVFSTVPVGSGPTQVRVETTASPRKVTRLDMNYLCALAQDLEKHPAIQPHLRFFPNTSLYLAHAQYRYIAYRYDAGGRRVHHLTSSEQNEYLDGVLALARAGATVHQLVDSLRSDEVSEEEAAAYIGQILEAQLVVSELEPALTGDDFLVQIRQTLQAVCAQHPDTDLMAIIQILTELEADLKALESSAENRSTEKFEAIERKISQLSTPFDRKVLFQIDTFLPQTDGQLNKGLLNKLVSKIPTLMKLVPPGNATLEKFKEAFRARYEEEEIPLVIALDPEMGLGYPADAAGADVSPLIDGLETAQADEAQHFTVPAEHRYLLQKIADAQLTNRYQIEIQEDELRPLEPRQASLPLTNSALFSVIREHGREQLVLNHFGGMNGTALLGRFGHTDPAVLNLLHEISQAEDEARPDLVFADLVHLPEARTGNVIIRPALKTHQIPFLGKASVDPDSQLPVTDLMVSLSGNTLRLRSKSLNKTVVPRLSNAHNYANSESLDLYHFLCDLQTQHQRTTLSYWTSSASRLFVFIPRIVLDNLILAEAQWNLRDAHAQPLVTAFKTGHWAPLQEAILGWRRQFRIPRYITLTDSDNELYVDLDNQWLAETFVNEIKSRSTFTIKEFLYRADTAVVESGEGWHTNQFVVAFKNQPTTAVFTNPKTSQNTEDQPLDRKFLPGSEWLYYKIYTGIKTADSLLTEVMHPLTERFRLAGWTDQFFFIRLSDPNHHFRFRFHLTDVRFLGEVIRELHDALAPYLANRSVTSVGTDTYNRELERYGQNSIRTAEAFFHVDSQTTLAFLSQIEGAEGEECRWRFGLKMMHDVLDAFGLDVPQRIAFTEQQTALFGREFGYNAARKKQLDGRYKEIEPAIQQLFDETCDDHRFFYDLSHERSAQLQPMVAYFRFLHDQGNLALSLESLLDSLIHMTINRLFRNRQRHLEYSLYYHLHKYYRITYGRLAHGHIRPAVASTSLPAAS